MSILQSIKSGICKPHRASHPFLIIAATVSILGRMTPWRLTRFIGKLGLILFGFVWYFFRNPKRIIPVEENIIVSPADGTVSAIDCIMPPANLGMPEKPVWRVSIFLSVFNVHLQRIPAKGTVTSRVYIKGKFLNASLDKASEHNERNAICMTLPNDKKLIIVQIAGLIARRIVCEAIVENQYETGDIYGLIRFGSRVDLYLPEGCLPNVQVGQTMIGGETIVSKL
ncbi:MULTISPECIES: phosphatidylserine decarboxylase [Commensalibacter]|uniref:Phosphatidylserine decarboxylase proenzyme n=2 Tax=Commensalibacter TaxID=1079922 RepID=W7DTK5_9PROT|nr:MULTISPECIES: phosphatidylserine decarboxylase [Commensalibacter]EUK18255.1 phosphatidylserine decarboxylase [Commensalibacter papalotli (ex Servin-Garciduenas et al. 2014)]CAI3936826.1 Phosphatidylserine decarboxylase (Psd) (PDB:6L06) [Commensalibacter papalotli (ex Botero et al. 2024)]CAI3938812.1 Phosphatidylserine decarboxylase (Psd) (PDB:6L06) [Commensalibacter papalotli (ex Botero et al. 2024)]